MDRAALDRDANAVRNTLECEQGTQNGYRNVARVHDERAGWARFHVEAAAATAEHELSMIRGG